MKRALKGLIHYLRMKIWKTKERKRLAQGHKMLTPLAQALSTKTIVGRRQGLPPSSNSGKGSLSGLLTSEGF